MRKTILTAAILATVFVGCKDQNKTETAVETETVHEHVEDATLEGHADDVFALDNAWMSEIELDNGKKWDANIETTDGVNAMLGYIDEMAPTTVAEYHELALKLNDEKNIVIKECTMEGPSHDNLHVFLHPLIDKIAALGKVSTAEQGAKVTETILENLNAYKNYFN